MGTTSYQAHHVLGGVVPAGADELQVRRRDGTWERHALPRLAMPGVPEYEIVLLDIGASQECGLRLVARERVVAERVWPAKIRALLDC